MRPALVFAAQVVGAIAVILALTLGLFVYMMTPECTNLVVAEVDSPSGALKAVVFQRECGVLAGSGTCIALMDADEALGNGKANVFVADGNHGVAVASPWGVPWAEARWEGEATLVVRYDGWSRVFRRESQVRGVTVRYEALDMRGADADLLPLPIAGAVKWPPYPPDSIEPLPATPQADR